MRLYLRNGEILVGEIQAESLAIKTKEELQLKLEPALLDMLFFRANQEKDGKPLAGAAAEQPIWPGGSWRLPPTPEVWTAEDVIERGPRGASPVRTVTEADVVNYVNFSGELNPLYVNVSFAEQALFGERIAPPMLCFCLGFSAWLRELLRLPLGGGESSAGHLGDRWQVVAPVRLGDTLEVRHQPVALRRTRSQPTRGIVTFGLQLVNQHEEVVQRGEVDMMLAMRSPAASPAVGAGRQPGSGDRG